MRLFRVFLAITCLTQFSHNSIGVASIPDHLKSIDLDQEFVTVDTRSTFGKYFDKYVPYNLTPTQNTSVLREEIQKKVSQKVTDEFMNGDFFKQSVAGKTISKVEKATNKSFSIGDAKKQETVHTFKFNFKALERNAEIDYSGFFNSHMVYNMDTSVASLSLTKPLDEETSLSLVSSTNIYQVQLNPTLTLTHHF
ncbi:MAG: hypothetical protein IPM57_07770 [Oligoflexia bacterium]|nr:hypothetical protein [Oligoflexia bacterium]